MGALQNTVFFLIFLGVLVTVHELGHFLAAKWAGVKVLKFSIGFGPKIFSFTRGETEYQVAWVPLGGFVRMAGDIAGDSIGDGPEPELAPEEQKRGFLAAPWWKRAIIVAAGPAMNLIFPIGAYFFVFLGEHEYVPARVGFVDPALPAAAAGFRPGDLITKIEGTPINRFDDIGGALEGVFDREISISVKRGQQDLVLKLAPARDVETSNPVEKVFRGKLGIMASSPSPIIGVPTGSAAEAAGLKTFDRIASVNGKPTPDLNSLEQLLLSEPGPLRLVVLRSNLNDVGGAGYVVPEVATVTLDKGPGPGLAAMGGAELGDTYIWTVIQDSAPAKAGMKRGDRLVAIDGSPIGSYYWFTLKLRSIELEPFTLTWRSTDGEHTAKISQVNREERDILNAKHKLPDPGIRPRLAFLSGDNDPLATGPKVERLTMFNGPKDALLASLAEVPRSVTKIAQVMKGFGTGKIGFENVGGPIMLFQIASKSAEAGLNVFLANMALVSVNLALVNLLPIPVLDGFGLVAAFWEGIRRRPIPAKAREVANIFGLVVLAMLVVRVFYNDIMRSFGLD